MQPRRRLEVGNTITTEVERNILGKEIIPEMDKELVEEINWPTLNKEKEITVELQDGPMTEQILLRKLNRTSPMILDYMIWQET